MKKIVSLLLALAILIIPMTFSSATTLAGAGLQMTLVEGANGLVTATFTLKGPLALKASGFRINLSFNPAVATPCDSDGASLLNASTTWTFEELDGDGFPEYATFEKYFAPASYFTSRAGYFYSQSCFYTKGTDNTNTFISYGLGTSSATRYVDVTGAAASANLGTAYFKLASNKHLAAAGFNYATGASGETKIFYAGGSSSIPATSSALFALDLQGISTDPEIAKETGTGVTQAAGKDDVFNFIGTANEHMATHTAGIKIVNRATSAAKYFPALDGTWDKVTGGAVPAGFVRQGLFAVVLQGISTSVLPNGTYDVYTCIDEVAGATAVGSFVK